MKDQPTLLNPSCTTIVHHTCKREGTKEFIEKNAPFFAALEEGKDVNQFLGAGFYFWDDHLELAHLWGSSHYDGEYYIIESEAYIGPEICFDLVGCRQHMKALIDLESQLNEVKPNIKSSWTVGSCIEFLKELNDESVFPFKAIRAVDMVIPKKLEQKTLLFVNKTNHFTVLNPKIAICMLEKSLLLRPINVIH